MFNNSFPKIMEFMR